MTKPLSETDFLRSVMELRPATAVFDCDGTLWPEDAGTLFMEWSIAQRMVAPDRAEWIADRHARYRRGLVAQDVICGEMTTVYAGLREDELRARAREFYREHIAPHVFPEMKRLVETLRDGGAEIWAVSSTNVQMIEAALEDFGIPPEKILATRVACNDGVMTENLLAVPTGAGKREALTQAGVAGDYAAFGNSIHDSAMLASARWPFAVNPNLDLLQLAEERGWPVYWPHRLN